MVMARYHAIGIASARVIARLLASAPPAENRRSDPSFAYSMIVATAGMTAPNTNAIRSPRSRCGVGASSQIIQTTAKSWMKVKYFSGICLPWRNHTSAPAHSTNRNPAIWKRRHRRTRPETTMAKIASPRASPPVNLVTMLTPGRV